MQLRRPPRKLRLMLRLKQKLLKLELRKKPPDRLLKRKKKD